MDKLHPQQLEVLNECIKKGSGGMSLCMGFGKTLISINHDGTLPAAKLLPRRKQRAHAPDGFSVSSAPFPQRTWLDESPGLLHQSPQGTTHTTG